VPANAPAAAFWSLTVYDVATRALIANKQKIADKSSRMDLIKNDDGSVDIYIGPDAGKGGQLDSHGTGQGMVWLFPLLLADGSLFRPIMGVAGHQESEGIIATESLGAG
jgi:hypothetical protein